MAGCSAEWRSFGRYTYVRNNVETTNTYPSGDNMVTAVYQKDTTNAPITVELNTAAGAENPVTADFNIPRYAGNGNLTFKNEQKIKVKKVVAYNGTQLISTDPINLTGAAANNQFQITHKIGTGAEAILTTSEMENSWSIAAGAVVEVQNNIYFSKALTDVTTTRYIDITIGNDNIDFTYRLQIDRKVAPVAVTGSGVAVGAIYTAPSVTGECEIDEHSAFTALYVLNNFIPGNYKEQYLSWSAQTGFPKGTTVTMMELSSKNVVSSYWYYKADANISKIPLVDFKRMGGTKNFEYTAETEGIIKKYMFVVDFANAVGNTAGSYKITFGVTAKDSAENSSVSGDENGVFKET